MTASTLARTKTLTKSGKSRRVTRLAAKNPGSKSESGGDTGGSDEDPEHGDEEKTLSPSVDAPTTAKQDPPSRGSDETPAPTGTDGETVAADNRSTPEDAETTSHGEPSSESAVSAEMTAVTAALQHMTTVVAGLQAQAIVAAAREDGDGGAGRGAAGEVPLPPAANVAAVVEPAPVTVVARAATGDRSAPRGEMARHGDEEVRTTGARIGSAAPLATTATPNTEMAAMATAVQQLTAMVSRLQQPAAAGARSTTQHGQRAPRQPERFAGRSPGPPDDDGSSSEAESSSDDGNDPDDSAGSDSERDDEDSDAGDSSGERRARRARRDRRRTQRRERRSERRNERDDARQPRRKSVKDLELPTYTPSPKVSVSTWIDRVDLALKGAEESGRGKWTDKALYYIMGNKLMENAARWWVNMNRRLPTRKKTWSNLKKALLRRYGLVCASISLSVVS
ncbi:hypothetical protein PF008_g24911 [Phytophthora fragariae]|uniref:Uncharacterized protein n=1 Tax=Phytophthora fragariae TaxID=53985 RepID=A0A6G0QLI8_9STRA|nr:hypothetical protein PF008_g24911 [Phytophthora fragariae]